MAWIKLVYLVACPLWLTMIYAQGTDPYGDGAPTFFPSPNATGTGWEIAFQKAQKVLSLLTLEEKVTLTTGGDGGGCVGAIPPIERVGFEGLCLGDSSLGLGNLHSYASGYAPGITVAATWNRHLMRANAFALGHEFYQKGVNVALGPLGTLQRFQGGGTNYEGYGSDPFVVGVNCAEYVIGLQSAGVQSNPKQYAGYDTQQLHRFSYSSNIPDKSFHEVYSWPYAEAIKAGAASIMCAYNLINNTQACESSKAINGVLKTELGFQGYMLSDWYAVISTDGAVLGGLDMNMPGGIATIDFENAQIIGVNRSISYFGGNLTQAVNESRVTASRVDDMALRILTPYYALKQDSDFPPQNLLDGPYDDIVRVTSHAANAHIRQVGVEAAILLKNVNNALPLNRPRRVAVFGTDAGANPFGPNPTFINNTDPQQAAGTLTNGFGSGITQYPYVIDPLAAIQERVRRDLGLVDWSLSQAETYRILNKAALATVCLTFVHSAAGESLDRNLTAWDGGDQLVLNVASRCKNTIVVIHSVGPIIVESWADHPNVTAILYAGLPGQETGNSLVDLLWGDENPSGKLPFTIAKREEDYIGQLETGLQINYTEDVFIDYRNFASNNIEVRYPFGHGLSYSNFTYSGLNISKISNPHAELYRPVNFAADAPGGDRRLFERVIKITANITNTGPYLGKEVAQLYLKFPAQAGQPPSGILRGFDKVEMDPGQTTKAVIELRRKDISYWDVVQQLWVVANGTYTVDIGSSSQDLRVTGTFEI